MTLVWCEFVCTVCAKTTSGKFTVDYIPRKQMKLEATKKGWKFVNLEPFCSQACLDRYIAERKS